MQPKYVIYKPNYRNAILQFIINMDKKVLNQSILK